MSSVAVSDFAERLTSVLKERLQGANVDVSASALSPRISGHIIWDGFRGLDSADRQMLVRGIIRDEFGAEASAVSLLMTLTTLEYEDVISD